MRKIYMILALITLSFGLVLLSSCTETETDEIVVGISLANADEFTTNMAFYYQSMAVDYNVRPIITNAGGSSSTQIANVESLIAQGPDVIVLRAIDEDTADTASRMINDAGIKIVIDEVIPTAFTDYDILIAGDQITHGRMIGEYIQDWLDVNPTKSIHLGYINGGSSDNIRKRYTGILETVTSTDRFTTLVEVRGAGWAASAASALMEDWLTAYPTMNAVACANDELALAVVEVLTQAGKLDDFLVFGVDGSPSGQQAIRDDKLSATTFQDVRIQVDVVYTAAKALYAGETVEKTINPEIVVLMTKDNIDEVLGN